MHTHNYSIWSSAEDPDPEGNSCFLLDPDTILHKQTFNNEKIVNNIHTQKKSHKNLKVWKQKLWPIYFVTMNPFSLTKETKTRDLFKTTYLIELFSWRFYKSDPDKIQSNSSISTTIQKFIYFLPSFLCVKHGVIWR